MTYTTAQGTVIYIYKISTQKPFRRILKGKCVKMWYLNRICYFFTGNPSAYSKYYEFTAVLGKLL